MSETKKRILGSSRQLFNQFGYSQVTIRMIAKDIGISSGNLNYHYKIRDSILEDLYFEMVSVFDARIANLGNQSFSIESIKKDIESSMETMVDYLFFWTDLYNLLSQNKKIREHFEVAYTKRKQGYEYLFQYLIQDEMLSSPSNTTEYNLLASLMIDFSNTWIYSSQLYNQKKVTHDDISYHAFRLLSMIYPYLTKKGKTEYKSVFPYEF